MFGADSKAQKDGITSTMCTPFAWPAAMQGPAARKAATMRVFCIRTDAMRTPLKHPGKERSVTRDPGRHSRLIFGELAAVFLHVAQGSDPQVGQPERRMKVHVILAAGLLLLGVAYEMQGTPEAM